MISKEDFKTVCFCGNYSGNILLNKQFRPNNHFVTKNTSNEIDEFCWQLRDGINEIIENQVKFDINSNLSGKEKRALHN